jgi:hypothetical protein
MASERITLDIPGAPGRTVTGDPDHVRSYVKEVERQLVARTQWPGDGPAQMTALALLFPSMTRHDGSTIPGVDPWDPGELVNWLNSSGEPTGGSRHVALFLLSIWNSDDWAAHGLRVRKPAHKADRRIGRFDLADAMAVWDSKHRQAAFAWLLNPFWP